MHHIVDPPYFKTNKVNIISYLMGFHLFRSFTLTLSISVSDDGMDHAQ